MSILCSEAVDEARDFHEAFHPRHVPDKACRRALTRYARDFVSRLAQRDSQALANKKTFTASDLTTALSSGDGMAMPDFVLILDGAEALPDDSTLPDPAYHVSLHQQYTLAATVFPAFHVTDGKVYPVDLRKMVDSGTLHGWEDYASLSLWYVPLPAQLTTNASTLDLPECVRPALVTNLALWMANRTPAAADIRRTVADQAALAEETAMVALQSQTRLKRWVIEGRIA